MHYAQLRMHTGMNEAKPGRGVVCDAQPNRKEKGAETPARIARATLKEGKRKHLPSFASPSPGKFIIYSYLFLYLLHYNRSQCSLHRGGCYARSTRFILCYFISHSCTLRGVIFITLVCASLRSASLPLVVHLFILFIFILLLFLYLSFIYLSSSYK